MGAITIGAFDFGESKILAYLYSGVLEKAGYEPIVKVVGNREIVEPALESGPPAEGSTSSPNTSRRSRRSSTPRSTAPTR